MNDVRNGPHRADPISVAKIRAEHERLMAGNRELKLEVDVLRLANASLRLDVQKRALDAKIATNQLDLLARFRNGWYVTVKPQARRNALRVLNRIALIYGSAWRGSIYEDGLTDRFQDAVMVLWHDEVMRRSYFEDADSSTLPVASCDETGLLLVSKRDDCHPFDPARYIPNAKPFSMVPYKLEPDTETTRSALDAIPGFTKWKRISRIR